MKLNIFDNPPPLVFEHGGETFSIMLRRFTGEERAHVIDASEVGYAAVQTAVEPLIVDWINIRTADGSPLPIQSDDGKGGKKRNVGAVLGAMPAGLQMRILGAILAFMGLPNKLDEQAKRMGEAAGADPIAAGRQYRYACLRRLCELRDLAEMMGVPMEFLAEHEAVIGEPLTEAMELREDWIWKRELRK